MVLNVVSYFYEKMPNEILIITSIYGIVVLDLCKNCYPFLRQIYLSSQIRTTWLILD